MNSWLAALYDPDYGYYMGAGEPEYDFRTAVDTHPVFAAMVATAPAQGLGGIWILQPNSEFSKLGSGRGSMASAVFLVARELSWGSRLDWTGVEIGTQRRRNAQLKWSAGKIRPGNLARRTFELRRDIRQRVPWTRCRSRWPDAAGAAGANSELKSRGVMNSPGPTRQRAPHCAITARAGAARFPSAGYSKPAWGLSEYLRIWFRRCRALWRFLSITVGTADAGPFPAVVIRGPRCRTGA